MQPSIDVDLDSSGTMSGPVQEDGCASDAHQQKQDWPLKLYDRVSMGCRRLASNKKG